MTTIIILICHFAFAFEFLIVDPAEKMGETYAGTHMYMSNKWKAYKFLCVRDESREKNERNFYSSWHLKWHTEADRAFDGADDDALLRRSSFFVVVVVFLIPILMLKNFFNWTIMISTTTISLE